MDNANKKQDDNDSVNLGILFDGPEDSAAEEPSLCDTNMPQENRSMVPEVIQPYRYRLVGDLDHRPGEDAWAYLDRIAPLLLKELVGMATAPPSIINARVKLDALKELIQRPMPARTVYDIRTPAAGSEFDRMSDTQVMDFVHKQIGDMRKEEIIAAEVAPVDDKPVPKE